MESASAWWIVSMADKEASFPPCKVWVCEFGCLITGMGISRLYEVTWVYLQLAHLCLLWKVRASRGTHTRRRWCVCNPHILGGVTCEHAGVWQFVCDCNFSEL